VEVLSALRRQARQGWVSSRRVATAVEDLLALPVAVYPTGSLLRWAWELRDDLTIHDACCVALAEALGTPLLTADSALRRVPVARCPIDVLA
jgi:predicted nucleic acid-binding protein